MTSRNYNVRAVVAGWCRVGDRHGDHNDEHKRGGVYFIGWRYARRKLKRAIEVSQWLRLDTVPLVFQIRKICRWAREHA